MRTASNPLAVQDTDSAIQGPDLLGSGLTDISWFFPEGFEKIGTIDNLGYREFKGREFSYKFFKAPQPLSIAEKWQLARDELRFGRIYAPDVYLGLRLLRLEQGLPEWVSFKPSSFILGKNTPGDIYDLALVARRGKKWRDLPDWLSDQADTFDSKRVAAQLLLAINQTHLNIAAEMGSELRVSIAAYVDSVLSLDLSKKTGSVLGLSFSDFGEEKLLDLFERHRQLSLNQDYIRGIRTHGAMLAANVMVRGRGLSLQFANIENFTAEFRTESHPYLDIATLAADLSARGFEELSIDLEQAVLSKASRTQQLLFKIFRIGEGLRLASSALGLENDLLQSSDRYLFDLLKSTFELKSSGLIVLRAKRELVHQLRGWFEQLADSTSGVYLWDGNTGLQEGLTIYFPEFCNNSDRQLLTGELLQKKIPAVELLVVNSGCSDPQMKVWPPVGAFGEKSRIISADPANPQNTIFEILKNYSSLRTPLSFRPASLTIDSDYKAFGVVDEIY